MEYVTNPKGKKKLELHVLIWRDIHDLRSEKGRF